jgi:carbamoyltransferase
LTAYLGFSCSQHDPSVAVVNEAGEVVFAEANERALKCKRAWHTPPDALGVIEPILARHVKDEPISANLTWSRSALGSVGLLQPLTRLGIAAIERIGRADADSMLWRTWICRHAIYGAPSSASNLLVNLDMRRRERHGIHTAYRKNAWNHHLCHAAAACFSSPFDDAVCVVMDGMGEGSSTATFAFQNGRISRLDGPSLPNLASLGFFYSEACYATGFDPIAGEEWKVMGLAAYGKLDEKLYRRLRPILGVKNGRLVNAPGYGVAMSEILSRRTSRPEDNVDLAFTVQKIFEEVLCEFLRAVHDRWGGRNLILTGGCALNSSANGKILADTPFRNLHVPMAPGDDGNSIGAALLAWQADHKGQSVPQCSSPYLGTEPDTATLARVKEHGVKPRLFAKDDELTGFVASKLARGSIVGWMQGRAEFGHRALGNRSILADPRADGIKDRLNASVKFREDFRPFAPSILHEHGPDYFEDYALAPYMDRILRWRPGQAPAGVRHADGTGRLQSVTKEANPLFHQLISAFHARTGVPILLNTSFNVMGRPIIHDVEDALGVFFTSGLDLLVIGGMVFRKPDRGQPGISAE